MNFVETHDGVGFRFRSSLPDEVASMTREEREKLGFYDLYENPPAITENQTLLNRGYRKIELGYERVYEVMDVEPASTVVKYSKLKLYAAITALPDVNSVTAWNALQTWLNGKTIEGLNGWMAFSLAQEISNAHPLFEALYTEALTVLGLTREQGDALLAQCVLD